MEKLICPCFYLEPHETDWTKITVYQETTVYGESVCQGRGST